MMKHYNLLLLPFVAIMLLGSCFDDRGNYDYREINEIKVKGFGDQDTVYRLLYLVDTLRLTPTLNGTLDSLTADEDCKFQWLLSTSVGGEKQVVGDSRTLELPASMRPGTYSIYYRVTDKNTGLLTTSYGTMIVETSYTKGFLVLGDQPDGTVELGMVAFVDARKDTSVLLNMLENSGVPEMKNGIYVCHTGDSWAADNVKLWVMSETGSYFLDGAEMTGQPSNQFSSIFYTSMDVPQDVRPVLEFPKIAAGNQSGRPGGSNRGYLLSDGSLVWANAIADEYYGNPVNRTSKDPDHLLDIFPYVFYSAGYMTAIAAYDRENERFLITSTPYTATMSTLTDYDSDAFPWNQGKTGRTLIHGDNTRNSLGGASYGRSYALMKDKEGQYFVYAFYVDSYMAYGYPSAKKGFWALKKDMLPEIERATHFMFSSTGTLLYYVVGSKIYCHDYTANNERNQVVADFGQDEITWIGVDYWTERDFSKILVATYNPATGGTLRKFSESKDQNVLDWTEEKTSVWGGFPKIKCVSWRNSSF